MATSEIIIPVSNFKPTASNGADLKVALDTNMAKVVAAFDASVQEEMTMVLPVPLNYLSGSLTIKLYWRANATTGACLWSIGYKWFALQDALSGSPTELLVTTTTAGTANFLNVSSTTIPSVVAGNMLALKIRRAATSGSDTLAVDAELEMVSITYSSVTTSAKQYLWLPAEGFIVPTASSATFATFDILTGVRVPYISFTDNTNRYADYRFQLPSSYTGNLKVYTYGYNATGTGTGTLGLYIDAAREALGGSIDPSITTGSSFTLTASGTARLLISSAQSIPVTAQASDDITIRLRRDNSDTSVETYGIFGVMVEFDAFSSVPSVLKLDPESGAIPAANGATVGQINGTNTSLFSVRFADGNDEILDMVRKIPGIYLSGGTLRIRWVTPASSGNMYLRVDTGSPAVNSASDPSLSAGTPTAYATSGANVTNELTVNISSGLVADDLLHIRIVRLGSDALDTLSNYVDMLEITCEVIPTV